ncbi:hypothetical protein [Aureimonas sp. SK2]|uniref:hypothetical protein n=1 Tax=Aureimonas sp. SK2 TaxID=3015992 RepID=UPI002444820F|nr:hypothetical protein [Aureimonas sp. SK2]
MSGASSEKSFEIGCGLARLFELAMRDGRTPPREALELLAKALGTVYRDIARAHRDPAGCPCGWKPADDDLTVLAKALRDGAGPAPRGLPDLRALEPAGRA